MKYWAKDNITNALDLDNYEIAPEGKTWVYPSKELIDEPQNVYELIRDHISKLDGLGKDMLLFVVDIPTFELYLQEHATCENERIYYRWMFNYLNDNAYHKYEEQ